ncbi:MAG: DUF721 domain-containing protein [Thermodesulfobacteriota bacterium]
MEKLGEVLNRVFNQELLHGARKWDPILRVWPKVVGPFLARRCWPVSLRKGVLMVRVAGPLWMQELQLQKSELLERIGEEVGRERVRDIRFTTRGARSFALSRTMGSSVEELVPPRSFSDEERAWTDQVLGTVRDPALRPLLKRIMEHRLRDPRKR